MRTRSCGAQGRVPEMAVGELAGEVAVVTGSAQGIGEAIARRFAAAGACVVVADLRGDEAEAVAASIRATGGEAVAVTVDIADPASVGALHAAVRAEYGLTTILVANAARITIRPFLELTQDEWDATISTNITGSYTTARVFCEDMIQARRGSIVVISSVNGLRAQIGLSAYNVTKAALVMLARTMALELARYGVRVNAITPGDIATAVIDHVADQADAQTTIPLGRYGRADEVAEMALFLASGRAGYTTGSVMGVDGGLDAQLYPGDIFATPGHAAAQGEPATPGGGAPA